MPFCFLATTDVGTEPIDNGTIRKAISSYQLKQGARPYGSGNPGGFYDGTFIDDFAYVEGGGDLDECNGMTIENNSHPPRKPERPR
ncbi:MAG: YHYH protein [Cyanobacteria bacterium J06639_14]